MPKTIWSIKRVQNIFSSTSSGWRIEYIFLEVDKRVENVFPMEFEGDLRVGINKNE